VKVSANNAVVPDWRVHVMHTNRMVRWECDSKHGDVAMYNRYGHV
jgi:hypothetical protein